MADDTPIDAQATVFTFDGTVVGGILTYNYFAGVVSEVLHQPLNSTAAVALPGLPDFGQCLLNLYRNKADAGQVKIEDSLRNRQIKSCVLTYKDGETDSFDAFCLVLPTAGSKDSSTPVNQSACILRVCGPIS